MTSPTLLEFSDTRVVVPFSYLRPDVPLIVVEAEIGAVPVARLLLDTGNGVAPLFLSRDLSERIGFAPSAELGPTPTFGVGKEGRGEAQRGHVQGLAVGSLRLPRIECAVSDAMDGLAKALDARIDGNLGHGFLKEFAVTIDFEARTLTLERGAEARPGVGFALGKKPLIAHDAKVNGQACRFVLDTGSGHTCLSRELAERLGLRNEVEIKALGVGGTEPAGMTTIDRLEVGEASSEGGRVAVVGFLPELSRQAGIEIDGILGHDFISRYRLTIDYPNGILVFGKPTRKPIPGA